MALFISFEGGEGSGKSTQASRLVESLEQSGIPAILFHEPGSTRPRQSNIRDLIKGRPWASLRQDRRMRPRNHFTHGGAVPVLRVPRPTCHEGPLQAGRNTRLGNRSRQVRRFHHRIPGLRSKYGTPPRPSGQQDLATGGLMPHKTFPSRLSPGRGT